MSDLADIAAAAGIVIVDTVPGDGGDADTKLTDDLESGNSVLNGGKSGQSESAANELGAAVVSPESALEALCSRRYTMDDPDYAKTVGDAEFTSQPPCVRDYRGRRSRDDSRHRGGRGGGSYGGRGHYNDNRSYRGRGDYRSWHHRDGGDGRQHHWDRDRSGERSRDRSGDRPSYRDRNY